MTSRPIIQLDQEIAKPTLANSAKTEPLTSVSITPAQGVYGLFSAFAYTPWQALGEFIDNSVSSWMSSESEEPLEVKIEWDPDWDFGNEPGRIKISDNAMGISLEDFPRAFELATPPNNLSNLNQFGVGLKVASCWFGKEWSVETSVHGEAKKRTINFNVDKIVQNNLQQLEVVESEEDPEVHYTIITLTKLVHPPTGSKTVSKIKKHLPKLFRKFIEEGDLQLTWNGEVLTDVTPNILVSPSYKDSDGLEVSWEKNFTINVRPDLVVNGYARVFDTFARQHTGLNYFWRGRLIQGNVEPFNRPQFLFGTGNSFRTGRLYIEIDASELHVTSDKTSIDFGKSGISEEDFLTKIKNLLSDKKFPLLLHAENYRSTKPPIEIRPRIDTVFGSVADQAQEVGTPFLEETDQQKPQSSDLSESTSEIDFLSDRLIQHEIDGKVLLFKVCCVDSGPSGLWIDIEWSQTTGKPHLVYLNLAHPFVNRHLNPETLQLIMGFGVSMLYGEYKALTMVSRDELRVVRNFTDRFMRFMARYQEELDDGSDN